MSEDQTIEISRNLLIGGTVAIIAVVALGVVLYQYDGGQQTVNTGADAVLATVNGEDITQADVDQIQTATNASTDQALNQAVINTLLLQKANEAGQTVSRDEAETALQEQLSARNQTLEGYKQLLQSRGVSYDQQIETYREQTAIQQYVQGQIDNETLAVTEEETRAMYNRTVSRMPEAQRPSYDDLKTRLESMVRQQKQRQATQQVVQDIVEQANITVQGNQTFSLNSLENSPNR